MKSEKRKANKLCIIADKNIPFLKGVLEPYAELRYLPGREISKNDVKDTDALLIRTRTKCNKELLEDSKIKFIATATIGFDHIDRDYCESRQIHWVSAPGCNSASVAQYITSALLQLAVSYKFALKDKVLGIIGIGNVGSKVAKVGQAFGMQVLQNDPPRARKEEQKNFSDLNHLLTNSDIITMHVPLTDEGQDKTLHLANYEFFEKIKPGSFFINSSRGEVTDEKALKTAIKGHKLAGAVLDVWENEPKIDRELLDLVFLGTPHIAGYSTDGKANGSSMVVNALSKFFKLDFEKWYPGNIPLPENTEISLDFSEKYTLEEIILPAVSVSYNISADDLALRNSPETFEKQRADYPLRREFPVFNIKKPKTEEKFNKKKVFDILTNLGFRSLPYN